MPSLDTDTSTLPLLLFHLSLSVVMYGWCVIGGAPVKPCIHAKIHFTSTALISLQPEAHKSPQCVWSRWTNAAYGHHREWIYSRPRSLGRTNSRVLMFVSQFNTGRNNPVPLYQQLTRNNNLCVCLISWVHVGKCLHIAACFMSGVSAWAHVPVHGCPHSFAESLKYVKSRHYIHI